MLHFGRPQLTLPPPPPHRRRPLRPRLAAAMQALLAQNWRALAATGAIAVGYLGACSAVGRSRLLPPRLARKLTHIGERAAALACPACMPCLPCLHALLACPAQAHLAVHQPRLLPAAHRTAGTGPLYMLCWPMFSAAPAARWLAASVPAAAGLAFWAVGSGRLRFDALVASSSVSVAAGAGVG